MADFCPFFMPKFRDAKQGILNETERLIDTLNS